MTESGVMSVRALNRATLARQMLLERASVGVVAGVERLLAMQAQLARPPFIGLWSRLAGFRREALCAALMERAIVRATLMRATIHLMSAADYAAFRMPLQPALDKAGDSILRRRLEVDRERVLGEARAYFAEPHTFDDFRDWLAEHVPAEQVRLSAYFARTRVPLVQVPTADASWGFPGQADFVLAERWAGEVASESDPRELVLRYLAAYGPATVADFQSFSGMNGMKATFEGLKSQLVVSRDERKRELYDVAGGPSPDEATAAPVRFLPDYDSLLLAYADRSRLFRTDEHRAAVFRPNLRILATFLVDGFVAGIWSVAVKRGVATLRLEPFAELSAAVRDALVAEGESLAAFVEPGAKRVAVEVA